MAGNGPHEDRDDRDRDDGRRESREPGCEHHHLRRGVYRGRNKKLHHEGHGGYEGHGGCGGYEGTEILALLVTYRAEATSMRTIQRALAGACAAGATALARRRA